MEPQSASKPFSDAERIDALERDVRNLQRIATRSTVWPLAAARTTYEHQSAVARRQGEKE